MSEATGAIDPWSSESERFGSDALCWDHPDYETPFAAIAEFIQAWPGETPTSELAIATRHARLVETIAGYPEIATGRRPMDMPLHPKANLAYKLTNFLDKIPGPSGFEWHSLKTALLHYDLRLHDNINEKRFLHHLMKKIREHTTFTGGEYGNQLHVDEIKLITVLHSQSSSNIARFWPVDEHGDLSWQTLDNQQNFNESIRINVITDNKVYVEHEFRFGSIQKWIHRWTECISLNKPWLTPNASHHLLTGASVMLESILAKMRSYILAERRAGSIIIDGGGRLRYLSTNTKEEESSWFKDKITKTLLFDREHPHPFSECIRRSMNKYAPLVFQTVKHQFVSDESKQEFPIFFAAKNEGEKTLTRTGFQELIGPDITAHFLPRITTNSDPTTRKDGIDDYPVLIESSTETRWEFEACVLCKCSARPNEVEVKSTIREIIDTKNSACYVCPFHVLLFEIGKDAKIRLQSYPDLFQRTPRRLRGGEKSVTHMIKLDGNGIGQIFNMPVKSWDSPPSEIVPPNDWEELLKEDIMNLKVMWDGKKFRTKMEKNGHKDAENSVHVRRMQPLLRTQRRSISFNINWWLSLHDALSNTGNVNMLPWVMAGDDIVMVNHQQLNLDDISTLFKKFHANLYASFPTEVPLTFAGAVLERGGKSLAQMYTAISKLEEEAAWLWKWRASLIALREASNKQSPAAQPKGWDIIGKEKRLDLEEWLKKHDEADLNRLYNDLNDKGFVFTTEAGYPSLLLLRQLNENA